MPRRDPHIPVYLERAALQLLVGKGWQRAAKLHPAGPSTLVKMLAKGWVERKRDISGAWSFRSTVIGESALKAEIPPEKRKVGNRPRGRPPGKAGDL